MDTLGQPQGANAPEQRTASDGQPKEDLDTRTAPDTQRGEALETRTAPDDQKTDETSLTVSLNTTQAAQQLGVDSRTVRRYISEGIRTAGGTIVRLQARQVSRGHGPEWQIYQEHLEAFKIQRDRIATEGQPAEQLTREGEASQALTVSVQLLATELERRSLALTEAQQTIERLAREAGQHEGRSEELERQLNTLQRRVKELEEERDQWKQKAESPPVKTPRRIRLLSWRKEGEA